jgi:UDP-N-acetylglucosamine 2-epimerase
VIDVGYSKEEISRGIERAVSSDFRCSIADIPNPYGDGRAAEKIVSILKSVEIGPALLMKRFVDQRMD